MKCSYCGATGVPLQRDHIMSKDERRRHPGWDDETVPACSPCNLRKLTRRLVPVGYPRLAELRELTGKIWMEWDGGRVVAEVLR